MNLPATADFPDHRLFDHRSKLRVFDDSEALLHHLTVPFFEFRGDAIRRLPVGGAGGLFGDVADREKKAPEFILAGELIELDYDFLFEKLQLMKPDRGRDQHMQGTPFEIFRNGARGDLGTNGLFPQIDNATVRPLMGDIQFSEKLLKDSPKRFRFSG